MNTVKWMMRLAVMACALAIVALGQTAKAAKTDEDIRQAINQESIAAYKGSCPCPYSTDRAGRKCGARSAFSKPGGASPLCYSKDVTEKMVDDYRRRTNKSLFASLPGR